MVQKETIQKLKERVPKLFNYFLLLLVVVFIMYIILPLLGFLKSIIILSGWNMYQILNGVFPIIVVFIIFKISKQITPIFDTFSDQFIETLPGLKKIEKMSIRRILSDFTYIIIVILIVTTLSPLASKLTNMGGIIINVMSLVIILFLLYDAGKIVYTMFEKRIQGFNLKKKKSKK